MPIPSAQVQVQELGKAALDQGQQQLKQGPSKFDGKLNAKAQDSAGSNGAQSPDNPQAADATRQVEGVKETEKSTLNKMSRDQQGSIGERKQHKVVENQSLAGLGKVVAELEAGQVRMDKLLKVATSGKALSNQELLKLQFDVYRYTQELELTGKVVEKATTGLKETIKTQV